MLLGMTRNQMNGFGIQGLGLQPGEQGPENWKGPGPAPSYPVPLTSKLGLQDEIVPGVTNWKLYAGVGVAVVGYWLFKKRR